MVLWLVPKDILMEDGVRHLVHAPAQLTHGGDVALVREELEDLNEELVGQVAKTAGAEILEIAHGGGICGVDDVGMKKGNGVVEILFLMQAKRPSAYSNRHVPGGTFRRVLCLRFTFRQQYT